MYKRIIVPGIQGRQQLLLLLRPPSSYLLLRPSAGSTQCKTCSNPHAPPASLHHKRFPLPLLPLLLRFCMNKPAAVPPAMSNAKVGARSATTLRVSHGRRRRLLQDTAPQCKAGCWRSPCAVIAAGVASAGGRGHKWCGSAVLFGHQAVRCRCSRKQAMVWCALTSALSHASPSPRAARPPPLPPLHCWVVGL